MRQTMAYTVAVVLGIGVVWLGRSQPSESQPVPIESMAPPVQAPLSSTTPRILKFTVSLQSPDDLRVRPGDGVEAGDVLADRVQARAQLEAQRQRARLSLERIRSAPVITPPPPRPVPPVAPLPPVSYAEEAAAIEVAQGAVDLQLRRIDLLNTLPAAQVPPAMVAHEQHQLTRLQRELDAAQAALQAAQDQRAYDEYLHSLQMARRADEQNQQALSRSAQAQTAAQAQRDREFQIAQLEAQIQALDTQLANLSTVRSPYAGTIRRIKWLGQTDNILSVEITLVVGDRPDAASPPFTTLDPELSGSGPE
jgi:biotin carboxyl carrier protein